MKTLSEQLDEVRTELAAAQALLSESTETISKITSEKETLSASLGEAIAEKEKLSAEIETLKESIKAQGEEIENLKLTAQSAESKALEILGNQGAAPLNLNKDDAQVESLSQQFNKIQDPGERTAFWRKNKTALLKEGK